MHEAVHQSKAAQWALHPLPQPSRCVFHAGSLSWTSGYLPLTLAWVAAADWHKGCKTRIGFICTYFLGSPVNDDRMG